MTNKEKFREILEDFALAQVVWGLGKNGEPVSGSCIRHMNYEERLEWLNEEYKEPIPEVDWSKVAIDTPILVRRNVEDEIWLPRYFAKYENGVVYAWIYGGTSWTTELVNSWGYAKLAESEE